jgi:hypothetical protein
MQLKDRITDILYSMMVYEETEEDKMIDTIVNCNHEWALEYRKRRFTCTHCTARVTTEELSASYNILEQPTNVRLKLILDSIVQKRY